MAFTNYDTKEINCKVVYFGPDQAGKTENLRSILHFTMPELKSGAIELDRPTGGTKGFDFLPLSLGYVKDYQLKLHLFSLPLKSMLETVTTVLLKGLDGFVFVADSQVEKLADTIATFKATQKLLRHEGFELFDLPRVIQYNKRDLEGIVPIEILSRELNLSEAPEKEAVASRSIGTMETLELVTKQILRKLAPQ